MCICAALSVKGCCVSLRVQSPLLLIDLWLCTVSSWRTSQLVLDHTNLLIKRQNERAMGQSCYSLFAKIQLMSFLYVYVYVCIYIYIQLHTYIYIQLHIYIYIYKYVYMYHVSTVQYCSYSAQVKNANLKDPKTIHLGPTDMETWEHCGGICWYGWTFRPYMTLQGLLIFPSWKHPLEFFNPSNLATTIWRSCSTSP